MGGGYLDNHNKNHKGLEIARFCGFCFGKKGFTLIEIIAIIILLSVISLIVYPIINNTITKSKDDLYNQQIEELVRLSNVWIAGNAIDLIPKEGFTYDLTFEELATQGYIVEKDIINPKTGEVFPGCMKVTYNSVDSNYNVSYDEACEAETGDVTPIINLVVDEGVINSAGYAVRDFNVKVSGFNIASYKYCTGTRECEPIISVNGNSGNIAITNEGTTYVCVIGKKGSKTTKKLCKSYKLDKSDFVMGELVIDGTLGENGWYTSDVKLSVRDVEGVTSTLNINKIDYDTAGTKIIMTSTSKSGKTDTKKYTIKVDKTAPVAGTLNVIGTKGGNGWFLSDVVFIVNNGSDNLSGHASTTSTHTSITSNTTGTEVIVTTKDKAGNRATRSYTIKVNKDAPIAGELVIDGTRGENDWYVSDVKLSVSDTAGITSTLNITKITSDTKGTEVTMTSKNNTTGAVKVTKYTVKVDKTKPTIGKLVINGTEGNNGWYKSNVTFSVTNGSDTLSGHAFTTSSISSITKDTKGTKVILTTKDKAGNTTTKEYTIKMDKTAPTTPTSMNFVFGNWSQYTDNTWTNQSIYAASTTSNPGPSGSSDTTSGLWKYQISTDNVNWVDYNYTASGIYLMSTDGVHTRYFRAVDNAGNISSIISRTAKVDKTAPTVPTVTYNSGSNSCSWKNNYNLTLNSSDSLSGVRVYQVDWTGDSASNSDVASNFIPWNGYSSCNNRFRAVDNAGNVSEWTGVHHIHMDTEKPAHTNWWWGTVNKDIAQLYIQTTDNVGISRVQCPTSTATGGYNNWHWFNAVWDSSQNAYRCDITPSTFGHYNQTYATHLYIYDQAGNGGYYNATNANIPPNTQLLRNAVLGTNSSNIVTSGDGLYSQSTSKGTTYYFRGNPTNNYIKFANKIWRIIRVNEDGTIRLITQDNVISSQKFYSIYTSYEKMYYTNSEIKTAVENWYTTNITGVNAGKVASGNYFCEQAKVASNTFYTAAGNATLVDEENYTPSFNCTTDGNGKGVVSGKVGLITIDEVLFAGGVIGSNSDFYLKNGSSYWMMSPAGFGYDFDNSAYAWSVFNTGETRDAYLIYPNGVRPVINLNANTLVTGSGTSSDPYIVQ